MSNAPVFTGKLVFPPDITKMFRPGSAKINTFHELIP